MKLEDYPQTHEGAVAFVRDVFRGMGGRVQDNLGTRRLDLVVGCHKGHDWILKVRGKRRLAHICAMRSKRNLACVCKGIDTSSLQDSIVALGLSISGQR